jgi:hypothetical protein
MSGEVLSIKLGFTGDELLARRRYLGGSDATILMSGNPEAIHDLWERKTGRAPEPDLSDALPVQIGIFTEPLNVRWFERVTGRKVRRRNQLVPHPSRTFMACNLDGLTLTDANDHAVFEAKHVNPFANIAEIEQKYMAQLHHNMLCAEVEHAVLSVILGTQKYEMTEVALDEFFAAQLLEREKAFWDCVERDEPPPGFKPVAAPAIPDKWRQFDLDELDMREWPNWAFEMQSDLASWKETCAYAKSNANATKRIKELLPDDVNRLTYSGVAVTRSKTLAVTIKETK